MKSKLKVKLAVAVVTLVVCGLVVWAVSGEPSSVKVGDEIEQMASMPYVTVMAKTAGTSLATEGQAEPYSAYKTMEVPFEPLFSAKFVLHSTQGQSACELVVRGRGITETKMNIALHEGGGKVIEDKTVLVPLGKKGRRDIDIMVVGGRHLYVTGVKVLKTD